ncbi:plasma membrane fusion protein PRM1 [Xylariales sp. AK1849]|nr:plasma membrane fusion protein PRM1 [Xylariales sp. AK1849]
MAPSRQGDGWQPDSTPPTVNPHPVDFNEYNQNEKTTQVDRIRGGPTPYLGLQARLSQVWFNRWTVLLLLVLVRVLILLASLNDNLADAKIKALSACTKVEDIGSAMASMPHYLSVGVNHLAASGITDAVHAMMKVLDMVLTGVEELILFVINMMTSTYTCLIAAAVHGGLNVSALVVTKSTDAMNDAIQGIAGDITTVTGGIQTGLDDTWGKLKSVIDSASFGAISLPDEPKIDLSDDVSKLKNVKIDSSGFVSDLDTLNDDLPTFAEVQNFTRNAVSIPFDLVKKALNDSYGAWQFDDSIFPVANKEALSFCSDNSVIVDFFEKLFEIARKAKIAFIVVLSLLAILVCVPMAWWEIRRWRSQQTYKKLFQQRKHDDMDMMMMAARPLTSKVGLKLAGWLSGPTSSPSHAKREILARWCVAYGTSLPALFVFSLAVAGFFSCLCQYIILAGIQKEVPALANQVGDFANEVVTTLEHVSETWANDANGVIIGFNNDINNDLLGYVVNATDAVNNTLNTFTDLMDTALTTAFNGTVLMDPIQEVVYCLIGLKVEAVQKGLTWVHDQAQVSLPLFPNDTFSSGAAKSIDGDSDLTSFLSTPSSVTTDEVTGAVTHVTDAIRNNIIQEALVSTGLLLVYVLVILIGVIRTLSSMALTKNESYTGPSRPRYTESPTHSRPPSFRSASEASISRKRSDESYEMGNLGYGQVNRSVSAARRPGHDRQSSHGHFGEKQ